jgi:hypothetical protein
LAECGEQRIRDGLLEVYQIDVTRAAAEKAIADGLGFIRRITQSRGLPGYEEVLQLGFTRRYAELSYACRCLADAESLMRDEAFLDAQYAAKFAIRLAVGLCTRVLPRANAPLPSPISVLNELGDNTLITLYRSAFDLDGEVSPPADSVLIRCFEAALACQRMVEGTFS